MKLTTTLVVLSISLLLTNQPLPVYGAGGVALRKGYLWEHLPDSPSAVVNGHPESLVPLIPSLPHCPISPQTINEITAMRSDAAKIAQSVEDESKNCDARRKYIADLTNFLNVWIIEVNRLKRELNSCDKYINLSAERINQLAAKEKLIKIEDVMACLNNDASDSDGWKKIREVEKKSLDAEQKKLVKQLDEMKKNMDNIVADKKAAGGEEEG